MTNNTLLVLTDQQEPINLYTNTDVDVNNLISSISLAVCSVLLSLTGFFVALQRSKCKNINFLGCLKCDRVVEEPTPSSNV